MNSFVTAELLKAEGAFENGKDTRLNKKWLRVKEATELYSIGRTKLTELAKGQLEILSVKSIPRILPKTDVVPINIENVKPIEMLEMFLTEHKISEEKKKIFIPMYKEILQKTEIDF